jgi:hypothetical protein
MDTIAHFFVLLPCFIFSRGINIDQHIFTQEDVSKFQTALYTLLSSDIAPDPKKFQSPDFVTLFFPLLDGKVKKEQYNSHLQFYRNLQNELLVLGYCSVPSTPERES